MINNAIFLQDIFVAGTDPTAAALVWAMVDLMKNPAAMKKAQEEVRKVCGKKERVEESDLQQLKYLNLVIKESLRLHPPAPLPAPRQTGKKCVIDGYTIPAKTVVFINARAIALDKEVWPNPEKFMPERFADSNLNYRKHLEMVPFGAGRRGCPGICFAEHMIGITLANLLHRFDWCFPQGMEAAELDMEEAVGLMNHKKAPLYLVAIPHEHSSTTNA